MSNHSSFEPNFFQDRKASPISDRDLIDSRPSAGIGGRALYCDQYLKCLDLAALEDWPAFNCENCGYEFRGKTYHYYEEFTMIPPEDELDQSFYALPVSNPISSKEKEE